MSTEDAIVVDSVTKLFKIYHERNQSVKGTVLRGGRSRYEEFAAVKDVSFTVPKGSTFGLIGSNGSGKSTLLKCIARILEPNQGAISTHGRLAAMLEVGSGFHSELSGRDNIYLNGSILGMSRREVDSKIDRIIDFAGVERFIDTPVKNYSSGMYVRLGFSVAIHTEPDILVVDEVLSVGDAEFQAKSRAKFDELKAQGTTIVLVSHNNSLVRSFCDQLAWLEKGDLRQIGGVEEVLEAFQGPAKSKVAAELPTSTGAATIDSVSVVGSDGGARESIEADEPVQLRMRITAHEDVCDPVFTITVKSDRGGPVYRVNSRDLGWTTSALKAGRAVLNLPMLSLPLGAGDYVIDGDVREHRSKIPAAMIERDGAFSVESGPYNSNRTLLQLPTKFILDSA
ncbi:ABC transporter ATP-binding protein [Agrococcus casei]|uniref:Teichoic acid export ATP-binding protein TagH n=1 Tax=Agrococcus casei LMG 22410 TaxID=1255656 RepID=A0A1R4F546_9MICO|nr:ABC transporter ATP-binding protein [Agrococcus casei]SJM50997.1 Teichoic acid export ATP-binding protein TagH [Agrococcus casei LMG 22410]